MGGPVDPQRELLHCYPSPSANDVPKLPTHQRAVMPSLAHDWLIRAPLDLGLLPEADHQSACVIKSPRERPSVVRVSLALTALRAAGTLGGTYPPPHHRDQLLDSLLHALKLTRRLIGERDECQ